MYHTTEDQEKHPENYILKELDQTYIEDECFDFISKPRQTQKTIGLYLKKIKDSEDLGTDSSNDQCGRKRFSLLPGNHTLEGEVQNNKGFWIGYPQVVSPLIYKLKEHYTVDIPKKSKKEQGVFSRPKHFELDHLIQQAKAGLLYPDEESSDSEEEMPEGETECSALRKVKYKICDPCKVEKKEKPKDKPLEESNGKSNFKAIKRIPTGCQCNYYGEHNRIPTVWDNPFQDEIDMLRQHEMNKVLRPYKHELLNNYYEKNPPVKFMAHESMKKTFPIYQISNL